MELSMLIAERPGLARKAWKTSGEAIPGSGLCSFSTRRISWVSEDELLDEDHLGKQSLCLELFYIGR